MTESIVFVTYPEVAERLRVSLCERDCQLLSLSRHRHGYTDTLLVHWAPRMMTQRGLWNFLLLVARVKLGSDLAPEPLRSWKEATFAVELGTLIGRRFPREFADDDRARARAALATPAGRRVLDKETRKMIVDWSRTR